MGESSSDSPWDVALVMGKIEGQDEEFHKGIMEDISVVLKDSGLVVEKCMTPFPLLKVSATEKVLAVTAESLKLKKPVVDNGPERDGGGGKKYLAAFEVAYTKYYENYGDKNFWHPCERLQIIHHILDNVVCCSALVDKVKEVIKEEPVQAGWLSRSLSPETTEKKILLLNFLRENGLLESVLNSQDVQKRKDLFYLLTTSFLFIDFSDDLRNYYGEEIAFYFVWLQHFLQFLLIPSLVGGLYYIVRLEYFWDAEDSEFIPFYTLLVLLWCMFYLKNWQRKNAALALQWGTIDMPEWSHTERLAFRGDERISFISGRKEKYYNYKRRYYHYFFSFIVTCFMLFIAAVIMFISFNLQGYIMDKESIVYVSVLSEYAEEGEIFDPEGWLSLFPVIMHSILIMYLNSAYSSVAAWLTDKENHEAQENYTYSLVLKRFLFEATDCYLPLFYLAFWQFDMERLHDELVALYMTDQVRRVVMESVYPYVAGLLYDTKIEKDEKGSYRVRHDIGSELEEEMEKDDLVLFDDYLEMISQFGYITMFAAAFPFAGLLAFVSNLVEIRSDLFKLSFVVRRPKPVRAPGIGIWWNFLNVIAFLSIVTNCIIFGLVSDQMIVWFPAMFKEVDDDLLLVDGMGRHAVALVFGIEHVVLLLCLIIRFCVPGKPEWVKNHLERGKYERREALHKLHVLAVQNVKDKEQ